MSVFTTFELLLDFSQKINQKEFQGLLLKTLAKGNKNFGSLTNQDDIVACLTDLRTWELLPIFEEEIEVDSNHREVWLAIKNRSELEQPDNEDIGFGFINHDDELQYLLSPMTIAQYISVDAPAGYGKTFLLKHLQERYRTDMKWLCAYVPEEMITDTYSVAKTIATDLDISVKDLTTETNADKLAQFLVRNLVNSEHFVPPRSFTILLDVTKNLPHEMSRELFDEFIAKIQERLIASIVAFRTGISCRFRVIVAERYATGTQGQLPIIDATTLPFVRKQLTPFNFDVLRLSVRRHWQDTYSANENDQIAAHLMYYTGGHPGFFVESLSFCSQQHGLTPDTIFETEEWKIWYSDKLRHWNNKISSSIPTDLIEVFRTLGVYRKLDYYILRTLIQENQIDGYKSEIELHDRLIGTNLLQWKHRFFQDDIIRRFIAIHIRQQNIRSQYADQCREAKEIYLDALGNDDLRGSIQPENWLIEILYQSLQQHDDMISDISGRRKLVSLFYEAYIPKYLASMGHLPQDQIRTMWHSIRRILLEDWEFRFTLNYFLREHEFSDEPFREFNRQLDTLWNK